MDNTEVRKIERAISALEYHTNVSHANCDTCSREVVPESRNALVGLTAQRDRALEAVERLREAVKKNAYFAEQAYNGLIKLCDEMRFPHDRDYFEAMQMWLDIKKETAKALAATEPKS